MADDTNLEAATPQAPTGEALAGASKYMAKPDDSYTKLAMKNMVRRRGTSLFHFGLTLVGVLGLLVGLAVVFH
ncbi:MAG: DUF3285 domain-containing protein [Synechococcaceae cyanobacterium SM2_3_60]|nr:DUF3285 domain-containing protein [Synechococcaceae cyanobacterium SM2_3_60]